jgi:hypothetical protein
MLELLHISFPELVEEKKIQLCIAGVKTGKKTFDQSMGIVYPRRL